MNDELRFMVKRLASVTYRASKQYAGSDFEKGQNAQARETSQELYAILKATEAPRQNARPKVGSAKGFPNFMPWPSETKSHIFGLSITKFSSISSIKISFLSEGVFLSLRSPALILQIKSRGSKVPTD